MTTEFFNWLVGLIAAGDVLPFYKCAAWLHVRDEVRKLDRYECQLCKARGRYKRAQLVHHVNHLKNAPEKALDIWYITKENTAERNLLSVCRDCHENVCHPERIRKNNTKPKFTTPERWD